MVPADDFRSTGRGNLLMKHLAFSLSLLLFAAVAPGQPHGIEGPRQANTELLLHALPDGDVTPGSVPSRLSLNPALLKAASGHGHEIPGVIPYRPSSQLWSDGAKKERYIALPGLAQIDFTMSGGWNFPEETVIVKNFSLALDERSPATSMKRLETRILFLKDSVWNGYTYQWNDAETDADLLPNVPTERPLTITRADGSTLDYVWAYPSQNDCRFCHNSAANFTLGLNTPQMNYEYTYPASGTKANQIDTLAYLSIFTQPVPPAAELPLVVDHEDITKPLWDRARGYLHANCAVCHRPNGPTPAEMDLRAEAEPSAMNVFDAIPRRGDLDLPDARLIAPGYPERSVLYQRISTRDHPYFMPPLATSRVDEKGTKLIHDWIANMELVKEGWVLY